MDFFVLVLPNLFTLTVAVLIAFHLHSDREAIKTNQRALIALEKDVMQKLNDLTETKEEGLARLDKIENYLKINKPNGK